MAITHPSPDDGMALPLGKASCAVGNSCPYAGLAEVLRGLLDAEAIAGTRLVGTTREPPPLQSLLNRWLDNQAGKAPRTVEKAGFAVRGVERLLDTRRPVTAYRPQDLREMVAKARGRMKGQTINQLLLRTLRQVFDLAVEEGWIDRNPVDRVSKENPRPVNRAQHPWSDAVRVVEDAMRVSPESGRILRFMLLMGVGQGEVKTLVGRDIDLSNGVVHFRRAKTGRTFDAPIYAHARELVVGLRQRTKPDQAVFRWRNPRKALATASRRLGLPALEPRSLRRSLIVRLLEQGEDPRLVARWQGHRDAALIFSRYGTYIRPEYERAAIERQARTATAEPGQAAEALDVTNEQNRFPRVMRRESNPEWTNS